MKLLTTYKGILLTLTIFILSSICNLPDSSASKQRLNVTWKPDAGPPVKIGVSSMITPVDTVKYYQEIIDYIGERIGRPVQMIHRRTYKEMDSLLKNGDVKVAFVCSLSFIKDQEEFGAKLLVAPVVNGRTTYHSYIIVHKDDSINSFAQLKGKVFSFTDQRSNSGRLYPVYLLKTMGTTPEKFFNRYIYSYSHNKSVELVAKKVVDGASVDSLVYEYMLKNNSPYAKQTRIIKRSPPFGIPPVIVTRDINPELRNKIRDAFLNINNDPKGRAILDAMMIDGFVTINTKDYDSIRVMERSIKDTVVSVKREKGKQTLYIGVIPRDNPRILYEKYQPLVDYLSERTPYSYELALKKNYEETVNAFGKGEIDIALLGPLTYLEAHKRYGAVTILKPKGIDNNATYKSVVIKRKDSPFKKASELKGRAVAFSASKSTSGNLMPRYLLANSGIHLSELRNYTNFDYHDSVVKAVLKGQYDAGAVRDSVARKYMKLGIEIIAESMPIPTGPIVVRPDMQLSVKEDIKKALLELDPSNTRYQTILNKLDDDYKNGFTETSDNDYEDIRVKINAVPKTCGKGCHPKIRL